MWSLWIRFFSYLTHSECRHSTGTGCMEHHEWLLTLKSQAQKGIGGWGFNAMLPPQLCYILNNQAE